MKTFYLIFALILASVTVSGHAYRNGTERRIDSGDRQELTQELTKGLEEFKQANNGNINFKELKPLLANRLGDFHDARQVSMKELKEFESNYDQVAAKFATAANDIKEKAILKLFESGFDSVEKQKLEKLKQGEICNKWDCEKGLDCAMVPMRLLEKFKFPNKCSTAKMQCTSNSQCCSGICELRGKGKKVNGSCQPTMRCFKPAKLNTSCYDTPTCQNGNCLQVNWNKSGVNECKRSGNSCSVNTDCCSNSCENNKCVSSFVCSNCVKQGQKATRGKSCCKGLYKNRKEQCVREFPPLIIPGGAFNKVPNTEYKILRDIANLIFPAAQADDATSEAKTFIKGGSTNSDKESFDDVFENGYGKDEFKNARDNNAKIKAAVDKATGGGQKYQSNCNPNDLKCIESEKERYSQGLEQYMKTPQFPIGLKSDFKTCKINFKNDYLHFLKKQNLLNLEFALAGFEFVMLGDGVEDFWKDRRDVSTYAKLKLIASQHKEARAKIFSTIVDKEEHLRCLCLDRIGYPKIEDADDKKFFEESDVCKERFTAYKAEVELIKSQYSEYDESMYQGDASGIKYKQMLVEWTGALADFQASLADINSRTFEKSYDFSRLTNSYNWNDTKVKEKELYKFTVYPFYGGAPTNSSLGYSLGAVLAAGAVAVVASIGGPALITAWGAAGIITAGSISGGVAQWALHSLKGAWSTQPPVIEDKIIQASYKCTKKGPRCQDYSRKLHQPVNNVCGTDMQFASNACLKHFIAVPRDMSAEEKALTSNKNLTKNEREFNKRLYGYDLMVDPWIPWGVDKKSLIKDTKFHTAYLQEAATRAITVLKRSGPPTYRLTEVSMNTYNNCTNRTSNNNDDGGYYYNCSGTYITQNGKYYQRTTIGHTGSHINVNIGYLSTPFIDGTKAGHYLPRLKDDNKNYILAAKAIEEIKKSAKTYIVDEAELLTSNDIDAQQSFADYVYKYHFIWPRVSQPGTVMYPPPGFLTYLDLMAHGFGTISYGNSEANYGYRERHKDYIADLLNTMNGLGSSNSLMTNKQGGAMAAQNALKEELTKKLAYYNNTSAGFQSAMAGNTVPLTNGTSLNGQSLTESDQGALNAVNRINKIRDEQKAAAKHYESATSGSDTASKMASVQKAALNNFFTPAAGDKGFNSFKDFASGLGSSNSAAKDAGGTINNYNTNYKMPTYKGHKAANRRGGGSGYGSDSSDSGSSNLTDNPVKGDDADKIASALDAMKKEKPALADDKEGQGLFDIVTKAYFRSYKRIFSPKKIEVEE